MVKYFNDSVSSTEGHETAKAFTLVELIVVIVILAILGTIAFVSLQGYSSAARDNKRLSDVRNLESKMILESIKGVPMSDLVEVKTGTQLQIGGKSGIEVKIGTAKFGALKENQTSFQDPLYIDKATGKKEDYKVAYAVGTYSTTDANGNTKEENYNFVQLSYLEESTNTYKCVGSYYKMNSTDAESLFVGTPYECGKKGSGANSTPPPPPNLAVGCTSSGQVITATGSRFRNPTFSYFITGKRFDGNGTIISGSHSGTTYSSGQLLSDIYTDLPDNSGVSCDTDDIVVCTGNQAGIVVSACGLGAVNAGTHSCFPTSSNPLPQSVNCSTNNVGLFFAWGVNDAYRNEDPFYTKLLNYEGSNYVEAPYLHYSMLGSNKNEYWAMLSPGNPGETWANSPCGAGYHIPSPAEWNAVMGAVGTGTNLTTTLKLPLAGNHYSWNFDGRIQNAGFYWTSASHPSEPMSAQSLNITPTNTSVVEQQGRGNGRYIRCFKN